MKQEEFKWLFKNNARCLINEDVGNILYSVVIEKSEEQLRTLITKYIEVKSLSLEDIQSWDKVFKKEGT
jgi:hypothetical protein